MTAASPATRSLRLKTCAVSATLLAAAVALEVAPAGAASAPTPAASAERAVGRTAIDGIYRFQTTLAELRTVADPDELNIANYGRFTAVFDRGRFVFTQQNGGVCTWQYGTFRLVGNRLRLSFLDGGGFGTDAYNKPGERFTFGFAFSRTALRLKAVPGAISPSPLLVKPWLRVSRTPRWLWASARKCVPPRKALPR
jgi:hypothetical protein